MKVSRAMKATSSTKAARTDTEPLVVGFSLCSHRLVMDTLANQLKGWPTTPVLPAQISLSLSFAPVPGSAYSRNLLYVHLLSILYVSRKQTVCYDGVKAERTPIDTVILRLNRGNKRYKGRAYYLHLLHISNERDPSHNLKVMPSRIETSRLTPAHFFSHGSTAMLGEESKANGVEHFILMVIIFLSFWPNY